MLLRISLFLAVSSFISAECIPFERASSKIGSDACVKGKVLKIGQSPAGTSFLDFCDQYEKCPFTVVVFKDDLRNLGDISILQGKDIEIHGPIEEFGGKAEIVLRDSRQLTGEFRRLPPLPKTYDASKHGNFSPGTFKGQRTSKMSRRRPKSSLPQDLGIDNTRVAEGNE